MKYILMLIALLYIGCTVDVYEPAYCDEEHVTGHYIHENGNYYKEYYNECTDMYYYYE